MGRRALPLKKIKKNHNRESSFTKRRNGLMKKATELVMLCDAQVSLNIFSSTGKKSEYISDNMLKMMEMDKEASSSTQEKILSEREAKCEQEIKKLAMELEEERKTKLERDRCIMEQQQKIEHLSTLGAEMRLRIQELEGQLAQLTGKEDKKHTIKCVPTVSRPTAESEHRGPTRPKPIWRP